MDLAAHCQRIQPGPPLPLTRSCPPWSKELPGCVNPLPAVVRHLPSLVSCGRPA